MKYNLDETLKINHIVRWVEDIITKEDLAWKFKKTESQKEDLVIKYGVDPTSPEMHIGHLVPIRKLKQFQELGYSITFLIGDFTARIGDPTGRSSGRKAMSEEEVLANAQTYKDQIFKILDEEKTKIVYNSSWLKPLNLEDTIKMLSGNTVNNLIKRKSFVERFKKGDSISGNELIYPFLQAYDSVALKADIELGGSDQFFNLMFGRDLQPKYGQEPQVVITTPLLEGLDGNEKMSKTLNNTVGLKENVKEMYSKIMTVQDNLIIKYFSLLTDADELDMRKLNSDLKIKKIHPIEAKKRLSREICKQFYSLEDVKRAEEEFDKVYILGQIPSDIKNLTLNYQDTPNGKIKLIELIRKAEFASSNNEARRLITQKGFSIDGVVIEDPLLNINIKNDMILKAGKDRYIKISYKDKQE